MPTLDPRTTAQRVLLCLLAAVLGACQSGAGDPRPREAKGTPSAAAPGPGTAPSSAAVTSIVGEGLQRPPKPLAAPVFFPPLDMVPRLKRGVVLPVAAETLEHGKTYWAVYLVVAVSGGRTSVPGLDQAVDRVKASGVPVGGYGALCDDGAQQALADVGAVDSVSALYFDTEGEARQFASELDPPPVRVVKITSACVD